MANDRTLSVASPRTRLLLTLLAAAGLCGAAQASGGPPEPRSCQFTAFVEETDPVGLNVRAAPSASAQVLGKLPPVWSDDSGLRVRARVTVTGAANGWFRIKDGVDEPDITGQPARPAYSGEGWVSGRKLVVKSQASIGRTRPDAKAPIAVQLKDDLLFDGDSTIAAGRLSDCQGQWAQVDFDETRFSADMKPYLQIKSAARSGLPKGHFRAWLNQICGIQETSCDGLASADAQ